MSRPPDPSKNSSHSNIDGCNIVEADFDHETLEQFRVRIGGTLRRESNPSAARGQNDIKNVFDDLLQKFLASHEEMYSLDPVKTDQALRANGFARFGLLGPLDGMTLDQRKKFLNKHYENRKSWESVRGDTPTPELMRAWANKNFSDRVDLKLVLSDLKYLDAAAYSKIRNWNKNADKYGEDLPKRLGFPSKMTPYASNERTISAAEVFMRRRAGDPAAPELDRIRARQRYHLP